MAVMSNAQVGNKWVKKYFSGNEYRGSVVTTDTAGNVYIAGEKSYSAFNGDIVTVKYDSVGNQLWTNSYAFPMGNLTGSYFNWATKILVDNSGNVYIGGGTGNAGSTKSILLLKINPSGTLIWSDTVRGVYDFGYNNFLTDMEFDPAGNLVIAAGIEGQLPGGYPWFFVAKIDTSGNELWRNRTAVDYAYNYPRGIAIDKLGNIFAAGMESHGNPPGERFVVRKYAPSGVILWQDVYDVDSTTGGYESAFDIQLDTAGNVFAAGTAGNGTHRDFVLRKYGTAGNVIWTTNASSVSAGGWDEMTKLYVTAAGNSYITGYAKAGNTNDPPDMMTAKINSSGVVEWVNTYGFLSGSDDVAIDIAGEDNPENVVITGYSRRTSYYVDPVTIKYKHDGTTVWEKRQPSVAQGHGNSVVIAKNHNVYVTGRDGNSSTTMRIMDADVFLKLAIPGPGMYNFNNGLMKTAIDVTLGTGTGTGDLVANFLANKIANTSWCTGTNAPLYLSNYRWVVNSTLSALSATVDLAIDLDSLNAALAPYGFTHGLTNPANFAIYQRPLDGIGELCKLTTTYANGKLSTQITSFSEFFIGSETDSFNYIFTTVNDLGFVLDRVKAYPNPSQDMVNVDVNMKQPGMMEAILMDISGKEIKRVLRTHMHSGNQTITFSTADISNGLYFIKLRSGQSVSTTKIVVCH